MTPLNIHLYSLHVLYIGLIEYGCLQQTLYCEVTHHDYNLTHLDITRKHIPP